MNKKERAALTDLAHEFRANAARERLVGDHENDLQAETYIACAQRLEHVIGLPSLDNQYALVDGDNALWIFGAGRWLCVTTDLGDITATELREEFSEVLEDWAIHSDFPGLDEGAAKIIARFGVQS